MNDSAVPRGFAGFPARDNVEFISQIHLAPSTELDPKPTKGIDLAYFTRYARALEDAGFDYTLLPYTSHSADSLALAAAVGQLTQKLKTVVAIRPNTVFPVVAAQQLATLDQLSSGRVTVHLISGGNQAEQAKQGDYLDKEQRYARTSEFIEILRRAWTERAPFSHAGRFYTFDDFGPGFRTHTGAALPISIGGQSEHAFEVGARTADIFSFWGEPLAEFRKELERLDALASGYGREDRPRIWVTFRPIIGATEELAWDKARRYLGRIRQTFRDNSYFMRGGFQQDAPQNVGSQRALEFAQRGDVFDRALWTATAAATNGAGASTALVGTPETVAAAILDYIDLGADLVSIRGYDNLNDTIDYGRYVLPLVRQELEHRRRTGRRGTLQARHLGALAAEAPLEPAG